MNQETLALFNELRDALIQAIEPHAHVVMGKWESRYAAGTPKWVLRAITVLNKLEGQ